MAQIPSGFTFNDDITEDASERFPPPALGSTSINWNDAGSVYDAIQKVSEQFKQAFADLIDQSQKALTIAWNHACSSPSPPTAP